jgi:hypothetical protein
VTLAFRAIGQTANEIRPFREYLANLLGDLGRTMVSVPFRSVREILDVLARNASSRLREHFRAMPLHARDSRPTQGESRVGRG